MPDTFFEQIHSATAEYPYIDADRHDLSYMSHYHNEIELIPILHGSVTVFCHSGTVTAREGDIAVLMPGEIHSFTTETENRVYVIKLHCRNPIDPTDLAKYRFAGTLIEKNTPLSAEIDRHIKAMVAEHTGGRCGAAYAVNACANLILTAILRSGRLVMQDTDTNKKNEATLYLLNSVTSYIESHLAEPIPLSRIAAHCNMSVYYFAHTFKRDIGMTFFDYLTSYRMDIALRLLSGTDMSITEISHKSGFSTTRMFNRLFRARMGMSPSEYRKTVR